MTNLEWIRTLDAKELAKFLCSNMDCSDCFASQYCSLGKNGVIEWLKDGVKHD